MSLVRSWGVWNEPWLSRQSPALEADRVVDLGMRRGDTPCGFHTQRDPQMKNTKKWIKPAFKDIRLGFECTAYAMIRR